MNTERRLWPKLKRLRSQENLFGQLNKRLVSEKLRNNYDIVTMEHDDEMLLQSVALS